MIDEGWWIGNHSPFGGAVLRCAEPVELSLSKWGRTIPIRFELSITIINSINAHCDEFLGRTIFEKSSPLPPSKGGNHPMKIDFFYKSIIGP
jgi:hypothetical protein